MTYQKLESKDIIKFTIYHPTACEEMCTPLFIPSWKEKAQLAVAGKEWVDCNALGVSKWTAISFLMEKYQLNADEICCFGDNLNDIEMLKNAGNQLCCFQCPSRGNRSGEINLCTLLGKWSVRSVKIIFIMQ